MLDFLVVEALEIVNRSIEIILFRNSKLAKADIEFLTDDESTVLDAIAMRLLLIGEKIKKIEQHSPGLLEKHGIETRPIIRMRDFLSHHYDDVDYLIILQTSQLRIPELDDKIKAILAGG